MPWKVFVRAGHEVVFATEKGGAAPAADPRLLTGVLFGKLGAEPEPKQFYAQMIQSPAFRAPEPWGALDVSRFDALLLAGGHAPGMKQYLGSAPLQQKVREFFALDRPVGAICHGVLVAARAEVLKGRRTTCLPKYMERSAYLATFWRLGRYYRTYDAYVEDEVKAALARPEDFERGPRELSTRGTDTDDSAAFVVEQDNYVSARWPGDAYLFAKRLLARL